MVDFNKPISPIPPPGRGERIERIGEDKQQKHEMPQGSHAAGAPAMAVVLSLLKDALSLLQNKKGRAIDKGVIINHLQSFYNTLQALINSDKSHDPSFTQTLSSLWHTLKEDFNLLEDALGPNDPISVTLRVLLEEIDLYPPWEEHSLGFYLTQKAGVEWIPIPFMEILFSLHIGAKKSPLQNTLASWCSKTEDVISLLEKLP